MATERIPLSQPIESRNGTFNKDSYSSNCFFETRDNKREFVKRPGLVAAAQVVPITPPAYTNSQGLTGFNNKLIAVVANTVYQIDPSNSYAVTTLGTTSVSTNQSYFVRTFLDSYLFFHNKVNGYLLNSSFAFTSITGLPSGPYVSGVAFLDNYVFIGTTNNRIYNSDVGDPTTWNALNFVSFEQTTDILVGIAKHLNYLVAFGATSTQFWYDAGNATGSPLALAQSYNSEIGCASGDSIVATSNTVLWVGTSKTYGRSVYLMDGVSPIRVSTANIDKHLEADGLSNVSAYCYTVSGHTLYILTLHNTNQTLVYDLNEKMWYRWTQYSMQSNDQPNPGTYQESYFRPTFYTQLNSVPYVLDDDTATLYYLDPNTYQDNGQSIYCRTVTDIMDNGTTKRKFYGRLEIIGDKTSGTMQVRHSGDDYNTWSNYRSVDLNASRSQIYLSGADRRRAWEFLVTSNCSLRLDGAELDFRIGEMDQEQNVGGGRYRK
jgi:Phage stabilisation protein